MTRQLVLSRFPFLMDAPKPQPVLSVGCGTIPRFSIRVPYDSVFFCDTTRHVAFSCAIPTCVDARIGACVCVRVHILNLLHSALNCGFTNQGDQPRSSLRLHARSGRKDGPLWVSGLLLRS